MECRRQAVWAEQGMAEAKDFVTACLKAKPGARLTPAQALQHKWLKSGGGGKGASAKRGGSGFSFRRRVAGKLGRIGRWLGVRSPSKPK